MAMNTAMITVGRKRSDRETEQIMRQPDKSRRPIRQWTSRLALAAVVAALGVWVVSWTLAQSVALRDPTRAHRLAPTDGRIMGQLAASLIEADPNHVDRRAVSQLAKRALRQDATTVTAAVTLGILAQLDNAPALSREWFSYSQTLSRRNLGTQLWAIEDNVSRGNIRTALIHYDIALRTEPATADFLFPILTNAAADLAVRTPLVRMLATRPTWGENFLNHMSASGPNPSVTVQVFEALKRAGGTVPAAASSHVIDVLLNRGLLDSAWSYYALIRPGSVRSASRDTQFGANLVAPSRLDWNPIDADGITASMQRTAEGGIFDFAAAPSVGGPLLFQDQLLPPGRYRLEGRVSDLDRATGTRPYWTLTCKLGVANGQELGRVLLPDTASRIDSFAGRLVVPEGCPVQTLTLVAPPAVGVTGLVGRLHTVALVAESASVR